MTKPPIGVPRVYHSNELPVLYPGEQARPQFDQAALVAALRAGVSSVQVPITGWLVEPAPGWQARYGRCALCGQNLVRPRPRTLFRRARAPIVKDERPPDQTRYHDQYATWPELVAAELDRREKTR